MTGRIIVMGVGNDMRGDDGIGLAVVRKATEELAPMVESVILDGEPTRMIDAWEAFDAVIIVDAVVTGAVPGTIHRYDISGGDDVPSRADQSSSHALGVGESVALGRALERIPKQVVVLGVEGAVFDDGPDLSPGVAAAIPEAARALHAEVDSLAQGAH